MVARLTRKQSNVLEMNAHQLGLSYEDEQALVRLPYIEMLPEECSEIVSYIFDYLRTSQQEDIKRDFIRGLIWDILNKYREQANAIK